MSLTIEQIETEWAEDSKIDRTNLNVDSSNQLHLHSKYHKMLNHVKRRLRPIQADRLRLLQLKQDYYSKEMSPQQQKELGWEPVKRVIIKQDIPRFIESDQDVININLQIGELTDMVDFLESIIKSIYQKPFITKNIIENNKFISGII